MKNTLRTLGVNINFNTTFAMTHFLKLYYSVFILENKIDALVFKRTCVNLCYIMLEIVLICVNLCQFGEGFLLMVETGIKYNSWMQPHYHLQ
jgi:hypothetical protein